MMQIVLTAEQFYNIYKIVIGNGIVELLQQSGTLMDFLNSLWNLHLMKSHDNRFSNLYDDIYQHWINNTDDYDDDNLFVTRIKILKDDKIFIPFIEASVSPRFILNEENRIILIKKLNKELINWGYQLSVVDYLDEKPVYHVLFADLNMDTADIKRNDIPFYVEKNPSGYSHKWSSHSIPTRFPAFVLVSDDGWHDWYAHVQFNLFYYENADSRKSFGLVKIIKKESNMPWDQQHHYYVKEDGLPDEFEYLPNSFCSLGQDGDYYYKIKCTFPNNYKSIFLALRDAAVFSQIDDLFRKTNFYNCLTRSDEAERNIREVNLLLQDKNIEERYQFDYRFKPEYADNEVIFHFGFRHPKDLLARRIYAVIGKNGVGKTQFISQLPKDLSSISVECFSPSKPILSKVISISESNFDDFKPANSNSRLNYVYCGMVKPGEDGNIPKNKKELSSELLMTYEKISRSGKIGHLKNVLSRLINEKILNELIIKDDSNKFVFNKVDLHSILKKMSSGENIIYYMFCMLEAELRYDSLVLLDEPETHLHPNAISELICSLDDMLNDYESCCILVTHSPMLVRELSSDCVYVMERDDTLASVRKPGLETLGANLTMLTDDIFGSKEVQRNYKRRIAEMASYVSFDQIINMVKSKDLPLGLGVELYIRSLYPENDNEETDTIQ